MDQSTFLLVAATATFLIIADVWIVLRKGVSSTISWTMWTAAKQWPIVPFALGVLMGHLFWNQGCVP